jgi:hypothetical protein
MTTAHFTPNGPKYSSYMEELNDYQNHKLYTEAERRNTETVGALP